MKRHHILTILLLTLITWLITGNIQQETENRPIKSETEITGLYLLGMRKVWTLDKSVKLFNSRGKLIEDQYFIKDTCDNKYLYSYTSFDSLEKIVWLTGNDLTPQKIREHKYDSLNRLIKISECFINKSKYSTKKIGDIDYCELDTFQYDSLGNNNIKIIGGSTFIQKYNSNGKIIQITYYADTSEYVTNYFYDEKGYIKWEFGGFSNDSIYYKRNEKGQVVEEYKKYGDFITGNHKNWYDKKGNIIKSFLDIDGGLTYTYKYDKNNRLLKENRAGNFMLIFFPCVEHKYEYY